MTEFLGKRKLIKDISASSLQTGVTQVFGLVFFYIASRYLAKDDFGQFNWSSALGATIIAIMSLGLDLIFVKRLAAGVDIVETSSIHFFHTLISAFLICGGAVILNVVTPIFFQHHPLLLIVLLYLSVNNIANSFRLCLNGLEAYNKLARLAIASNFVKFFLVLVFYFMDRFNVYTLILSYGIGGILEFLLGFWMVRTQLKTSPKPKMHGKEYQFFILESLPQLGVVLFDSALARIDWILLGLIGVAASGLSVDTMTAEYSFTYKVFEVSKLPLLVIAPILLTRFSKLLGDANTLSEKQKNEIEILFRFENFVLLLIPLFFISVWSPFIDYFTNGKYGAVNESKFWILALCIPMHGLINFLWTSGFVQGQLKRIMVITIVASLLNLIANIFLIPVYGGMGAALAFLASTAVQLVMYLVFTGTPALRLNYLPVLWLLLFAFVAVKVTSMLELHVFLRPVLVFAIYIPLSVFTKTVDIKHSIKTLRGR